MMKKKSTEQLDSLDLKIPKYNKEQKIVQKALSILSQLGEPKFIVSENRWKTNLKAKDESRLWYARGLLEALLFDERSDDDDN